MTQTPALILNDISVEFPLLHVGHRSLKKALVSHATGGAVLKQASSPKVVRALDHFSAKLTAGDRVGLVGPNGAGKTTLLRTMAGIYEPVAGSVHINGSVATLLEITAGMNPDLTGWENIDLRGVFMGLSRSELRELAEQVEAFSELGDFLNMPIRTYSSGMTLRLSFAIATSIKADILLMDEWVVAGDAAFTSKAADRLEELVRGAGILVLATHNSEIIRQWCNKAMFIRRGKLEQFGDVNTVLDHYVANI